MLRIDCFSLLLDLKQAKQSISHGWDRLPPAGQRSPTHTCALHIAISGLRSTATPLPPGPKTQGGAGIERNYSAALSWLEKAAALGNASAQVDLARCYLQVRGGTHVCLLCTCSPDGHLCHSTRLLHTPPCPPSPSPLDSHHPNQGCG